MKLTHDTEAQKKGPEDKNDDKKGFAKSPMTEKLMGRILAIVIAASGPGVIIAYTTSSCTFQPSGIGLEQDGDTDTTHDSGPDADTDADTDSGHDAGPDVDADVDSGVDAGPDADVDAGLDGGPDADVDADVDAGPDADGGVDAGPDADAGLDGGEVDAGPVGCAVATTGSFDSVINSGTPVSVGGYVFEYVGQNASGDTLLDITCGGNPVQTAYACPIEVLTTINVPADGRTIQI
ncbi:MAG: hypothetical protein V1861_01655, partial [Candidatus Micrarchaeota archaeon]